MKINYSIKSYAIFRASYRITRFGEDLTNRMACRSGKKSIKLNLGLVLGLDLDVDEHEDRKETPNFNKFRSRSSCT